MKLLLIILAIIYLGIALLAILIQSLFSLIGDSDQSSRFPFKLIIKQSFMWPVILFKLIRR